MAARILVVEDDASLAEILRADLLMDGFEVAWASHAHQAIGLCLIRSYPISRSST